MKPPTQDTGSTLTLQKKRLTSSRALTSVWPKNTARVSRSVEKASSIASWVSFISAAVLSVPPSSKRSAPRPFLFRWKHHERTSVTFSYCILCRLVCGLLRELCLPNGRVRAAQLKAERAPSLPVEHETCMSIGSLLDVTIMAPPA